MTPGEWVWNEEQRQICQLIEMQRLWGETICRVWLPAQEAVVNLTAACLNPVAEAALTISGHHLAYIAVRQSMMNMLIGGREQIRRSR
jgi:hypothetical protein